jgi:hypothetical protein
MAATAGSIRAGRAFVELSSDDSSLMKGLDKAKKSLNDWGKAIAVSGVAMIGAATAAAAPLIYGFKELIGSGGALSDMEARTGIGAEALQELQYAAGQTGSSMEEVEASIRKMQDSLVKAANGSKSETEALDALGLSLAELQGLSPDKQFERIGEALGGIQDPAKRTALAMDLFGKSGTKILPMAQQMAQLRAAARSLGLVMDKDTVSAADKLGDTLDTVSAQIRAASMALAAQLLPAVQAAATWFTGLLGGTIKLIKENQGLAYSIVAIAGGLAAAGVAVTAFGVAFVAMGGVVTGVSAVISAAGVVMNALLSPITLVVAAVGAAVAIIGALGALALWKAGFFDEFIASFGKVGQVATETIQGIKDAVEAGDIELAFKLLWNGILIGFLEFSGSLQKGFEDLIKSITSKVPTGVLKGLLGGGVSDLIGTSAETQKAIEQLNQIQAKTRELAALRAKNARDQRARDAAKGKAVASGTADDPNAMMDDAANAIGLAMIQDEEKKAIAAIEMRYQKEIDAALAAGKDVRGIYAKRDADILAATTQFQNKRLEEQAKAEDEAAKRKADGEKKLADDIEELKIKSTKEGIDQQLALNELARRRELAEAERLGIDLAKVNEKYDLLAKGITAGGSASTSPIPSRGTFSNRELRDFGGGAASEIKTLLEKIARNTSQTADSTSSTDDNTKALSKVFE